MPKIDDESIFRLNFVLFYVQTHSPGVVSCVADERVFAAFSRLMLATLSDILGIVQLVREVSLALLFLLTALIMFLSYIMPLLLILIERTSSIRVSKSKTPTNMFKHQWYAGEC